MKTLRSLIRNTSLRKFLAAKPDRNEKKQKIEQESNIFITRFPPTEHVEHTTHPLPVLAGLAVAIKDIFCTRGTLTSCASAALDGTPSILTGRFSHSTLLI
jgi:Asp-tRNA(Asn)/Glu-tRNA(Gln) amidotransferase A subunit family amidase